MPRALVGAAVALAMAAPIAFPAAAGSPAPLRFAGVAWGTPRARVEQAYARRGWILKVPGEQGGARIVGRVWERSADLVPEYDGKGRLAAVTLKFYPESEGDALALYEHLVGRLTTDHGPPTETIAPARPVSREWQGRERRLLAREELTAAALWVSPAEDAAAVQLDAARFVWVRYESRAWALAHTDSLRD